MSDNMRYGVRTYYEDGARFLVFNCGHEIGIAAEASASGTFECVECVIDNLPAVKLTAPTGDIVESSCDAGRDDIGADLRIVAELGLRMRGALELLHESAERAPWVFWNMPRHEHERYCDALDRLTAHMARGIAP